MTKLTRTLALALTLVLTASAARAQVIRIIGASTAVPPVKDAGQILKKEQDITLDIYPAMNSTADKIYALGENRVDVAMIAHPLTGEERSSYPDILFKEIPIGEEATALAVSKDVWNAGVHSLTKAQVKAIHEEKIKNWKEVGGPDLAITGYLPDPATGIWACYIQWLYDDPVNIPDNHFTAVKSDNESKTFLDSTPGALVAVSLSYATDCQLHALAIKNDDGKLIQPTAAAVADHSYPMARPLLLIVKGTPHGDLQNFVKFMTGDRGQELIRKYSYLTLKDLGIAPPSF